MPGISSAMEAHRVTDAALHRRIRALAEMIVEKGKSGPGIRGTVLCVCGRNLLLHTKVRTSGTEWCAIWLAEGEGWSFEWHRESSLLSARRNAVDPIFFTGSPETFEQDAVLVLLDA